MTARRYLSDMLADVAEGVMTVADRAGLRATGVELSLPLDIRLDMTDDEPALIGELPQFITRTDFDPDLARLHVVLRERAR